MSKGKLRIVGTGISPRQHLTPDSAEAISASQRLLYLVPDPEAAGFIAAMAGGEVEDASNLYQPDAPLSETYEAMISRVLSWLRDGHSTCFALYGHPGVIVYPSHRLLRLARNEGHDARMLPAVSAEDCLLADLGIDPARQGCQTFWATDLLVNFRVIDPTMATIVWSIGVAGCFSYSTSGMPTEALMTLLGRFYQVFPPHHGVVIYEAASAGGAPMRAESIPLCQLASVPLSGASTLYIPPALPVMPDGAQHAKFQVPAEASVELFQALPPLTQDGNDKSEN